MYTDAVCDLYRLSVLAPSRPVSVLLQLVHLCLEPDASSPRQLHFSAHFFKLQNNKSVHFNNHYLLCKIIAGPHTESTTS